MTFSTIIEINLESKSFKHNFCKYLELVHDYLINVHHQNKITIKDIRMGLTISPFLMMTHLNLNYET